MTRDVGKVGKISNVGAIDDGSDKGNVGKTGNVGALGDGSNKSNVVKLVKLVVMLVP